MGESSNLLLYNEFRSVPENAQKSIQAGRLKGMTDINPMWRIKVLTEKFGPCGIGWKYTIFSQWLEPGADGVVSAFCNIGLQYKWNGEWSEMVPGTGGSAYVAKERNGLYTSDECYKQALTDAISVAAKALGIGADVYWDKDKTKYSKEEAKEDYPICPRCGKSQKPMKKPDGTIRTGKEIMESCGGVCYSCYREIKSEQALQGIIHEDAGDRV